MKMVFYYGEGDIRCEEAAQPVLNDSDDVLVRVEASGICGTDISAFRGRSSLPHRQSMGHEFVGRVEEVGSSSSSFHVGDRVVSPFTWSCGICEFCVQGATPYCTVGGIWGSPKACGAQAEHVLVPHAEGTLLRIPEGLLEASAASLTCLCDSVPTGFFGAECARVKPGARTLIIGDGAVGLCAANAANLSGASEIVVLGNRAHQAGRAVSDFGATSYVSYGELSSGGARNFRSVLGVFDSVVEAAGTQSAWDVAFKACRPGGSIGFVGLPFEVRDISPWDIYDRGVSVTGGTAPARAYIRRVFELLESDRWKLPDIVDAIVPIEDALSGYQLMSSHQRLKVALTPPEHDFA